MIDKVEWTETKTALRKWKPTDQLRWYLKAGSLVPTLQQMWTFEYLDKKNLPPDVSWEFGSEWRDVPTEKEEVPSLEKVIRSEFLKEEAA